MDAKSTRTARVTRTATPRTAPTYIAVFNPVVLATQGRAYRSRPFTTSVGYYRHASRGE